MKPKKYPYRIIINIKQENGERIEQLIKQGDFKSFSEAGREAITTMLSLMGLKDIEKKDTKK